MSSETHNQSLGGKMLNADRAPYFHTCPRCRAGGLEVLKTHSYCVNCNYFDARESDECLALPRWAIETLKSAKPRSAVRALEETNLPLIA